MIKPTATSVTSDTGELYRNWEEGIYTINTKQSQAVMGWVGDKTITLADTEFRITTRNASVAVQSLDDSPIGQSRNILITLASNAIPYKDLNKRSKLPFLSEPVRGRIIIKASNGMRLSYMTGLGAEQDIPVDFADGQYIIELSDLPLAHWLQLSIETDQKTGLNLDP